MAILRLPETTDDLIERRYVEIKYEMMLFVNVVCQDINRQFQQINHFVNRSFAQRKRFHRERFANNGTTNRRKKPMSTTKVAISKCMNIPLTPCDSSQLAAFGFDYETDTLAIQFKNKGGGLSDVYHYQISQALFEQMNAAESKGKFFGENIKALDCMRLVPDEQIEKAA